MRLLSQLPARTDRAVSKPVLTPPIDQSNHSPPAVPISRPDDKSTDNDIRVIVDRTRSCATTLLLLCRFERSNSRILKEWHNGILYLIRGQKDLPRDFGEARIESLA